jgi:hypothetical protein
MADSAAFVLVCEKLERDSDLDRLEARGTVRLALKESGLEARSVTREQMKVVLERVLPTELASRGVTDGARLCQRMAADLSGLADDTEGGGESPDAVFARLGGAG